jgi:hypothetical protein
MKAILKIVPNFPAFRSLILISSMLLWFGCGRHEGPPPGTNYYYEGSTDDFGENEGEGPFGEFGVDEGEPFDGFGEEEEEEEDLR